MLADIRVSWLDPCKIRRYTVVGSQKMLVYDDIEPDNKIVIYDKGVDDTAPTPTPKRSSIFRTAVARPCPIPCTGWSHSRRNVSSSWIASDRAQNRAAAAEDGLQVIKVLESAQCSLLNGGNAGGDR